MKNPLQKRLEEQRFLHGIAYVEQNASGLKKMTTSELAHLNQILTGESEDPWRYEAASVLIPSGRMHQFNVVSNPVLQARDLLGSTQIQAGNGECSEAAFRLYSQLVLSHLFRDANRRTAALAAVWLVLSTGKSIDGKELDLLSVGDLRNQPDFDKLRAQFIALIS